MLAKHLPAFPIEWNERILGPFPDCIYFIDKRGNRIDPPRVVAPKTRADGAPHLPGKPGSTERIAYLEAFYANAEDVSPFAEPSPVEDDGRPLWRPLKSCRNCGGHFDASPLAKIGRCDCA